MDYCETDPSLASAYFFFDGRDSQKELQLHENLIRSLIKQFSTQCTTIPAALVDLYGDGHQRPSNDSLQQTLRLILNEFQHVYIIIDSLDECTQRKKLLNWIKELVGWKSGKLHLLATSREEQDIKKCLQPLYTGHIWVEGEFANRDIETYLDWMLMENCDLERWDEKTRHEMKAALMKGSQGMYGSL